MQVLSPLLCLLVCLDLSLLRFPCEFRSRAVLAKFLSGLLSVYRTFVQQDEATAVFAVAHVAIFRQLD